MAGSLLFLAVGISFAEANDFTAGAVLDKMTGVEQTAYLAGIVEALAYSRYRHDNKGNDGAKKTEGMHCVYDWFYKTDKQVDQVFLAFHKYRSYKPGAIIAAMVRKQCGEW
jgi:hypothetical protein